MENEDELMISYSTTAGSAHKVVALKISFNVKLSDKVPECHDNRDVTHSAFCFGNQEKNLLG